MRGFGARADCADCLDRLGLAKPKSVAEWFYAALVRGALAAAGS
jgi:disulfide oxidoreductase YuzD